MNVYTTCADCGLLLQQSDPQFTTHPNCDEPADPQRDLAQLYTAHLLAGRNVEADQLAHIIDRRPPSPQLLATALRYAGWGWSVFPLRPGLKVPATPNGFKDATTDTDTITTWWTATPLANIGLPTGRTFDVIDVDTPHGWRSYWQMQDADAIPDIHGVVSTAGAGLHLYVTPSGEGNKTGILPGVDFRGAGGYVVAPPSIDHRGHRYLWRHRPSPVITNKHRAAA